MEVASQSPAGAANIRERLRETLIRLGSYPRLGRLTDRNDVRRLLISPYPYFIDYRIVKDEVIVTRFRHAARRP